MLSLVMLFIAGMALSGCTWFGGKSKPDWVDGAAAEFSSNQYLLGQGQAANKSAATDQAYAAVSRIFKAEVAAQAKDWESYLLVENRGSTNTERRLTLDQVTNVSTDKVLENVKVLDTWYDRHQGMHYVLAGMHRGQGEAAMMDKMRELDRTIETDLLEARRTTDKLTKVRNLRRATRNLVMRDAYNADLRVIRSSGQGTPAAYRVNELSNELDQFLSTNLVLAVEVTGDHAEPIQGSLMEGLIREGLHVTTQRAGSELLVRGTVRIWPIDVRDPQFKYVRWCRDAACGRRGLARREGRAPVRSRSHCESPTGYSTRIFLRPCQSDRISCIWRGVIAGPGVITGRVPARIHTGESGVTEPPPILTRRTPAL